MTLADIKGIKLPESRTAQKSFDKLVAAAEELFYRQGYAKTTIGDITGRAGLAIGTFYIYFESKYPLYLYLMVKYEHELKAFISYRIKDCTTRLEKEREGIKAFIIQARNNPACYNIIWESLYIDPALFKEYYSEFAAGYIRNLERSRDELYDVDLETVSFLLMGISNFAGLQAIFTDDFDDEKLNVMVDTIYTVLKRGLFKEKNS